MPLSHSSRLGAVAAAGLLALAGCGGNDNPAVEDGGGSPSAAAGPVHVHGLGINPKDRSLFIATHTGLFRVGRGQTKAARVGDSEQDTMGFTVAGPDRFLGSGHPSEFENGPPLLGLIRSTDAGRTWTNVSLSGEADFHVLRAAGRQVYGFDASNARFMVSGDEGESWDERTPPGPLIDLAVDPRESKRAVASAEDGVYISRDAGKSWRPLARAVGLLAWPVRDRLYLVDAQGVAHVSGDGGRRWSRRGSIGGQPAALLGQGAEGLYAALRTAP